MKRLVVRLVLSVLMSVLCFSVAQAAITYPLQLSAHILPPYGCRLSDYVVQGMERLNLTVLQRDLRYSNYDFLVRMQVKQGTKIVISSTAGYTVKSGQLTRLNSANLFNGLTADITAQDKYKENGFCLNEGAYEFVFQAFDAKNTALPVSEPVYFHTYLSKALPPACVFPANGSCVDYKSAAVSFAWMEKSVSMPSNGKRYSLEVYEMPEGFDGTDRAENLAGASEPVYRKDDINGNVTVHTAPISAGMFIKGRTYVWRVRSYSADFGQADSRVSGHVENNGYSQYSAFKFGTCVDVEDVWKKKDQAAIGAVKYDSSKKPVLESVDTSGAVAVVEWLHEPEKFCGYVVEWNMADTALAPWGQKIVSEKDSFAYISGLSYGVDYIVRLRGVICNGSEEQAYSACADNVLSFRLEKRDDAECGNPVPQVTSLVSLKEAMKEGDVLSANGHDVTVLTCEMNVSGSDTTFTGTGLVSYGFLKNFFNLTVKFDNVKINDRKELLQGMVYANTDLNNCLDLNLNRLANKGSAGSGPAQRQTAKFDEFSSADNIPENKAGLAGGTMYAWDADGNRVECGTLEDTSCASNNLFVDSRHGEVLFDNLEGMEWNPPFDREKRPFDRNLTFSDYYENLDGYSVPWIGVPEGGATKVKATLLQGASVNPNDVHFVLRTGSQSIRLNAKRIDGNSSVATYEVPVFADKAGDKGAYLELSAVVSTGEGACSQQLVLGVAKVYALKREHFNVRLVPCHNVSIDEDAIAKKLNEIYKPLGKTFTVTEDELFYGDTAFAFIADTFDVKNISRRSTETEDMTFLKYIYREVRGFSKDSVYLFVLPKANIDGVTGFMPRGKHVGYLFCGENETIDERTVAHELGHGLFTLEHAFDYIDGSPVGSTNNLMDYSDGTNLKVWQWTHMDTHGPVLPFFDDAEDAMMESMVESIISGYLRKKEYFDKEDIFVWEKEESQEIQVKHRICLNEGNNNEKGWSNTLGGDVELSGNIQVVNEESEKVNNSIVNIVTYKYTRALTRALYYLPVIEKSEKSLLTETWSNDGCEGDIIYFYHNHTFSKFDYKGIERIETKTEDVIPFNDDKLRDLGKTFYDHHEKFGGCSCVTCKEYCSILFSLLKKRNLEKFKVEEFEKLNNQVRANQKVLLCEENAIFEFNGVGFQEKKDLTVEDIKAGNFKGEDLILLYEYKVNEENPDEYYLSAKAIGISNELKLKKEFQKVNFSELSDCITKSANKFLADNKVISCEDVIKEDIASDEFPGGGKVLIKEGSSCTKVLSEAGGIMVSLLKEGEIEEGVYSDENKENLIKAPGFLTGSVEVGASAVTDLTSLAYSVFSLATDKEERDNAVTACIQLKKQMTEKPEALWPLLLSVVTGYDTDIQDKINNTDDKGVKKHLVVKQAGNVALTAGSILFSGGTAAVSKLGVKVSDATGALSKLTLKHKKFFDELEFTVDDVVKGDFLKDFKDNADYAKLTKEHYEGWKLIKDCHPEIAKDIESLEAIKNIRNNDNASKLFNDEFLKEAAGTKQFAYKELLNTCKDFAEAVNIHRIDIDVDNFSHVCSSLKSKSASFRIGAKWLLEYMGKNAEDFKGKKLVFESVEDIDMSDGLKKRRADLKVCCVENNNNKHIYYEFKSVMELPPKNFNEQFAKDLLIDEVTNLNQLKWIFDGKKIPEGYDFKEKMKEAIEKMDIPNEALEKFKKRSAEALKNDIIKNFDNIFQVK